MLTQQLVTYLNQELNSASIKDYCPNGLQVEGREETLRIITGVTASQRLIDTAIKKQADLILVHHGYFWKGESEVITGMKRQRIAALLANNINLVAYHLPIDIHPVWGNNVQLGQLLEIENLQPLETLQPTGIVYQGNINARLEDFARQITAKLGRELFVCEGDPEKMIKTVCWCTGGGQSFIEQVAQSGADLFITGEVSEQTIHIAREMDIAFIAAGHHATERYGVKAIGEHLANEFELDVEFVDMHNPA